MVAEHAGAPGVAESSAAMAGRGHDVIVYIRRAEPNSPEQIITPQGYTVVSVPAGPAEPLSDDEMLRHMGDFAEHLNGRWQAERPDVVHANVWTAGIAAQLAARADSIPTVQTSHGLAEVEHSLDGNQTRRRLEKVIVRQATWVAATCTEDLLALRRLGRSRTRISLVPCGVDLLRFATEGPIATRTERSRIIAVGDLLPRDGFDTVIRALPAIPEAEFVIVGGPAAGRLADDPAVRALRALAAGLGVADRVVFTGAVPRDGMPAMLRSADVVTCTRVYDALGMVALEAMACGVPVVASAVGAMVDTVVHDVTGRLVAPNRPRECAEAVTAILRDSFLRRSLGLAGRDRACARYSWDRISVDTLRIYHELVPASRLQCAASAAASNSPSGH